MSFPSDRSQPRRGAGRCRGSPLPTTPEWQAVRDRSRPRHRIEDNARLVAIRRELSDLDHSDDRRPPTVDEAVAAITARLGVLPQAWTDLPRPELKQFLAAVIENLEIDVATLETTFTVRLPDRATHPLPKEDPTGRLNFTSAWSPLFDTDTATALGLDRVVCRHHKPTKCYECSRQRRAA